MKALSIRRAKHKLWWILEASEVREKRKFRCEDCNDQLAVIRGSSQSIILMVASIDSVVVPVWYPGL